MPTRLLDVGDTESQMVKLVLSDKQEIVPYVALSHCWGKSKPLKTTKTTIFHHLEEIPESKLPQTFKDAVLVTRKLGMRYLWIDSLCIVQDDEIDWFKEAATMASVYSNAQLTVMGANSSSSEDSFLSSREHQVIIKEETDQDDQQVSFYLINTKYYSDSIIHAEHNVGSNPLFKRAWAVQERLLSRRKLIFCHDQVRWECNQLNASEDHQICEGKPAQRNPNLSYWLAAVQKFTACDITDENDVLPAMSGIARRTAEFTGFSYCAGIWLEILPQSLLWSPYRHTKKVKRETYVGPTFSWAASKGPVSYAPSSLMPSSSHEFCEYVNCKQNRPEGSDDPYGAVKAVALIVRGLILKATSLTTFERRRYLITKLQNGKRYAVPVYFDHEDTGYDIERVFVFPLFGDGYTVHGLVLLRATEDLAATWEELSGTCYQRIGYCSWRLSDGIKVEGQETLTSRSHSSGETFDKALVSNIQHQSDLVTLI
jgi:heterokaryon incompatibility protein (HET)